MVKTKQSYMKKVILVAIVAALTATTSCNGTQKVVAAFKQHCPESNIAKQPDGSYKVFVKCVNLYDTQEMGKYIQSGSITYDFAKAEVSGVVQSSDSIPNLYGILVTIAKGVKKK